MGYPHNGSIKPLSQQPLAPMQTVPPGLGGLQPSPMPHHPFQQFNQPPRPQSMGWRPRLQEQSSSESAPQFPQCGRSLPNQPPQGPSHWAAYQRLANQGPLGPSWEEQFLPRPTVSAVSNQQLSVQFLRPSTPPPCDLRFDYQESHSTDASYNGYSDDSLDTQQRAIPPTIFENTQGPFNHCLFRDFDEDRWWTENGSKSEEEGTHEPIEKDPKAASNYDPPSCDVLPSFHSNIKGVIRFRRSILIPPSGKIYEPKTLNNRLAGCKTIIIYGLPIKISEVVLFEIFGPMNRLKMIYARKKPRARIRFNKCDDAEKAFKFVGYKIHIDGNAGTEYTGYLRMEYSWKNRRKVQPLVLPSNGQYEVPLSHLYELKRTLRARRKNKTKPWFDSSKLEDETVKHALSLELTNRFDALDCDSLSHEDKWRSIKTIMSVTAGKFLGNTKVNRQHLISDKTFSLVEQRRNVIGSIKAMEDLRKQTGK
ncbi:hypothetical protein QYM36_002504, partial [Artemia franciscana]